MKLVGLTGGIASGKSSFSLFLRQHGVPAIDCDTIARDVVKKVSQTKDDLYITARMI